MSLKEIKYGDHLVIPITDGRLSEALVSLDSNLDDRVTLEDFSTYEDPAKTMREMIARNMEIAGLFLYPNQAKGLEKFFATYEKVRSFEEWYDRGFLGHFPHFNPLTGKLEFDRDRWDKWVKPYFSEGEVFSPKNLTQIIYDISETVLLLSGAPVQTLSEDWPEESVFRDSFASWIYNACAFPKDFREPFSQFLDEYQESLAVMVASYSGLKCVGEGCPLFGFGSEVSLRGIKYLSNFKAASNNSLIKRSDFKLGVSCFTGDTYVRKPDGNVIPLRDLEALHHSILSYEECDDGVRYQPPQKIMRHEKIKTMLIKLALKGENGEVLILKVTPNHPLLVERGLGKQWVKAGDLQDGDRLATLSAKDKFVVDLSKTVWEEGIYDLYNISFSTPDGNLSPTFGVSPDGKHWFFAHNLKVL